MRRGSVLNITPLPEAPKEEQRMPLSTGRVVNEQPRPPLDALLARLLHLDLQWVLLGLTLIGAALIFASWAIGISDVTFHAGRNGISAPLPARQVGYVEALNWSVTYFVLFPVTCTVLLSVLKDIPKVTQELEEMQVLRGPAGARPAALIIDEWKTGSPIRAGFVGTIGICLPAGYSLWEWFYNNLLPLALPSTHRPTDYWDWDWGVRCVMTEFRCTDTNRLLNAGFDLACFLVQFVYLSSLLTFVIYVVDFRTALLRQRPDVRLMPALRLKDKRRGFGQFEPMLIKLLAVVVLAFVAAYLVRIENLYLRSSTAKSLWAYVKTDILRAIQKGLTGGFSFLSGSGDGGWMSTLFDVGGITGRQTILASMGLAVLFLAAVAVVVGVVCEAAGIARTNALAHYAHPDAVPLYGLALEDEQARTESMQIWPMGYVRINSIVVWTAFAVMSLVYFKIGLIFFGFSIALILRTITKLFK